MKNSQIKKISRKIIKGNVGKSSALLLFIIAGILIFSVLPFTANLFLGDNIKIILPVLAAALIAWAVLFSAFATGSRAWFLFYDKKKRDVKTVYWFRPAKALKSTGLYAVLLIKKLMWAAAFLSPGAILITLAVFAAMNGGVEFNLFATWLGGGVALTAAGGIYLYFFLQRYFLVPYLKVADPTMRSREIFRKSRLLMNRNIKKAALMKLSFLPWIMLCLTLIPAFYVWTYYSQSCAVMANEIFNNQKKEKAA